MSTRPGTDDFYIGYLPHAARPLARFVRRVTLLLVLAGVALAALLTGSMARFSDAHFEFGVERTFEGVLIEGASPLLVIERPGLAAGRGDPGEGARGTSSYLLVAAGKFGAGQEVRGLSGHRVRLRGSLVYRDDQTMLELAPQGVEDLGQAPPLEPEGEELGTRTFVGEIVDSKCFFGVMKPGNLKPHRACAVRCISGGIPPVLALRDEEGRASYCVLVDLDGGALNERVLEYVAEPVRIEGRLVRRGNLMFLYTDPATIERLNP